MTYQEWIRSKPPKHERQYRNLCNCSNGKPRSNPWHSYHYRKCPYLKALDAINPVRE